MQKKLKEQAESILSAIPDIYEHHRSIVKPKDLTKFYIFLITKHLGSEELIKIILNLQQQTLLQNNLLIDALWASSLGLA